jgi:hypothetical protein
LASARRLASSARSAALSSPARPGAGDRAQCRAAAAQAHQRLRRGAGHLHLAEVEEEHVGRGIDQPHGAVGFEGREAVLAGKAHREHQLVHVAEGDGMPGAFHRGTELLAAEALHRGPVALLRDRRRQRAAQQPHHLLAQAGAFAVAARMQQRDAAREVVEDQQRVRGQVGGFRHRG